MKISVCIPTYKRPTMLVKALDSVLAQSVPAYEIMVGDDSPDGATEATVRDFLVQNPEAPIRYFHHSPGLGQAANVAKLFELATGELVTLLHDDDRFRPEAFKTMLEPLAQYPEVVASYGRQVIVHADGREDWDASWQTMEDYGKGRNVHAGLVPDPFLAGAMKYFPNNSYIVRAEVAKGIDYFAENRAGDACDWYFGLRLGELRRPFYFVEEFVADYYLSPESVARTGGNTVAGFYQTAIFLEDYEPEKFPPVLQQRLKETIRGGIYEAANINPELGWRWYFSRWHRTSIFSLGGARRLLRLLLASVGR